MDEIRIVVFNPDDAAHRVAFVSLNQAWLERYFEVEPHDLEQLHEPQTHILNGGGRIFLVTDETDTVIGTLALIAAAPGEFEMAKMTVAENRQGRGVGRKLCVAALEWARSAGAARIWLESNRLLTPALHLYKSVGFREIPLAPSPYARADIKMELLFEPSAV